MMTCRKCGYQEEQQFNVCPKCGADSKRAHENHKSKLCAGLLGIFLGCYGVHNFYLGYTGKAVTQLLLGIFLCFIPVSSIWGLIEGIMILAGSIKEDGNGNPLKE